MRRGEICVASFNPSHGREVGKARPCVIFQANWLTERGCETVIALPLTTQLRPGSESLRIPVARRHRLLHDCYVMIEKPRALDRAKFREAPLATLTDDETATIERALLAALGINLPT